MVFADRVAKALQAAHPHGQLQYDKENFRLLLFVPLQLIAAHKRLMGMSLPARVAVLIAVFLVLCTICAYTTFLLSHKRADYRLWVDPLRITVIVALVVAIPVIVYYVLRLWLEGHGSLFPDIDHAWKAGLAELSKQGIDVSETPLFMTQNHR